MTSSPNAGKRVIFVDMLRFRHEGEIVGQNDDGSLTYVKATLLDTGNAWDFSIRTEVLDQYLA